MVKPAMTPATADDALFQAADEAYYDAEYERCLNLLSLMPGGGNENVAVLLLRTRALLRSGASALAADVSASAVERASSADDVVVAAALRGASLRARRKPREASAAFAAASASLSHASDDARAEYAYYAAFAAWEDGELHAADALIEEALPHAHDVLRALLVQLSGWIEVRRERYAAAAERFLEALEAMSAAAREDLRCRGRLVHALAIIASETIDLRLAKRYAPYLAGTRWTSGIAREHLCTLACERFLALLRGDRTAAWHLSREAVGVAPSDALRAIAETNAAVVSDLVGDAFATRVQFETAWAFIDAVSWSKADEEERVALTNFAIEAADAMPAEARSAITLYRNITGAPNARLALHRDRRMQAFEAMAAGRVSEVLGKPKEAIESYERSRELWVALDYRMRAALVARDLLRLTGDARYRHDLDVALARAPQAWFAEAPTSAPASAVLAKLTRAERVVLRHLLGGENMKGIASALERSPYTVHNHTRRIFGAFDVRARAALIARCAELGITAEKLA